MNSKNVKRKTSDLISIQNETSSAADKYETEVTSNKNQLYMLKYIINS